MVPFLCRSCAYALLFPQLNTYYPSFLRLLLTLKSRSIVRLFSIPPHGKVVVGGCDDGCYLWNLYDGSSDQGDKNDQIR